MELLTLPLLIVWALTHFGLAYIVGHSVISVGFRRRLYKGAPLVVDLLECPACFGFWAGCFAGIAMRTVNPDQPVELFFLFGLFTSGSNKLIAHLAGLDKDTP